MDILIHVPPAIKFTVSKICKERICLITVQRSKTLGDSVLFALIHRTKCGLA